MNKHFQFFRSKRCCLQIFSLKHEISVVKKLQNNAVFRSPNLENWIIKSSVLKIPQFGQPSVVRKISRGTQTSFPLFLKKVSKFPDLSRLDFVHHMSDFDVDWHVFCSSNCFQANVRTVSCIVLLTLEYLVFVIYDTLSLCSICHTKFTGFLSRRRSLEQKR
mgnify:CR=1 FL=1